MSLNVSPSFVHLRQPGVSVVVNVDSGVPVIEYWGKELESVSDEDFLALASRPRQPGGVDVTAPIAVVPQHSDVVLRVLVWLVIDLVVDTLHQDF